MTVPNGTQWNIDGEDLRAKPLPQLALGTLDEVIEQVCHELKRAFRLIPSGCVL